MPAPANEWVISTEGAVALVAATAKTVLNGISATGRRVALTAFYLGFDGTDATAAPVLVEFMRSTQATAGTSTAVTPRRRRGTANDTAPLTAGRNYTVEPTALTLIEDLWLDPNKGMILVQDPLGREAVVENGEGLVMRLTAPAAVNCRAWLRFE